MGAALTATSIGITARVLSELGVLKTREGQIILGAAVIDDVLGLVVLAIVSKIAQTGTLEPAVALKSAVYAIGFLVVALVVGIPLGKWLVRIVGQSNVRGMLGAAAVAFALLVAWGAKKADSAPIVGAFAAGMALARTNRRHDIDHALKPVVDIFAPLFFVYVGAQVDVRLLNPAVAENRPALLLGLGLTADRLPREVRRGLLRLGKGAALVHRRGHGSPRRGRPDLRVARARRQGAARPGLRRGPGRGLRDDVRDAAAPEAAQAARRLRGLARAGAAA